MRRAQRRPPSQRRGLSLRGQLVGGATCHFVPRIELRCEQILCARARSIAALLENRSQSVVHRAVEYGSRVLPSEILAERCFSRLEPCSRQRRGPAKLVE